MAGSAQPTVPASFHAHPSLTLKVRDAVASWDRVISSQETAALAETMQKALDQIRPKPPTSPAVLSPACDPQSLQNVLSFYLELKAESGSSAAVYKQARLRLSSLTAMKDVLADMIGRIDSTCNRMGSVVQLNRSIAESTDQIRQSCQLLSKEKEQLVAQSDYLSNVLAHFDDSKRLSHRLSLANNMSSQEWTAILNRIDECLSFMKKHQDYPEARKHLSQFHQLRSQGLSKLCNQFQQILKASIDGSAAIPKDHFSISLLSFRSAASTARPLISILERKSAHINEYEEALQECVQAYYQIRQSLLHDSASQYIASLAESKSLPEFSRTASIYLIRICSVEARLFSDFFQEESSFPIFLQLISSVSSSLYIQIRSRIINEEDLDVLSDVINIVQCEILDDEVIPRGDEVTPIIPVLQRIVEDVQERLIYRANIFIRDSVTGFSPTGNDLDYPGKLTSAKENGSVSLSWYPTLEACLMLLSKIYRSVEHHVFEILAQDAIAACLRSLRSASEMLPSKVDSYLFMIRHLAILREQISPFNLSGGFTERGLDLSHVTESFRELISGRMPALMLTETEINSQLTIESDMKNNCELYIHHVVRSLIHGENLPPAINGDELVRVAIEQGVEFDPVIFEQNYELIRNQLSLYLGPSESSLIEAIRNQIDNLISEIRKTSQSDSKETEINAPV